MSSDDAVGSTKFEGFVSSNGCSMASGMMERLCCCRRRIGLKHFLLMGMVINHIDCFEADKGLLNTEVVTKMDSSSRLFDHHDYSCLIELAEL